MRVEVLREKFIVNIAMLKGAGELAMEEFYRVVRHCRASQINAFEIIAAKEGVGYTVDFEVLSYDDKEAVVSIYLDVEDETKAIYFKLMIDPVIKVS